MSVDSTVCERLTMWLTRPDIILEDLVEGLGNRGCHIVLGDRGLTAWCRGCVLEIHVWEEDTLEMIESLGTIAREAVEHGYRAVGLEVRVSGSCEWLCETVNMLLMRGGG